MNAQSLANLPLYCKGVRNLRIFLHIYDSLTSNGTSEGARASIR